MTKYHKELESIANHINECMYLQDEIHVNRRNGYYAVDRYYTTGGFKGYLWIGNYKETKSYLLGLENTYWFMKPF